MSNFSNPENHAGNTAIQRLLEGIAQECSVLGGAIAQIGDDISGELSAHDAAPMIAKFQAFDMLSQNAHAQARLLAHITGLLCHGPAASQQDLLHLVEDMPIHDVRHRLRKVLGIEQDVPPPDDDAEIWD